mgnify:CR=1 FL=1
MAFRYSDKYKKYSLDMHVNVTRDEFLKQFDPEALAKDIISTGAEAGMMYIQSHYGLQRLAKCTRVSSEMKMHSKGCTMKCTRAEWMLMYTSA